MLLVCQATVETVGIVAIKKAYELVMVHGCMHQLKLVVQVVHCVMYPRMEYDLPILSFDMVGKDDRVSLVCIDPCPVAMDRSLPSVYVSLVRYTLPILTTARVPPAAQQASVT